MCVFGIHLHKRIVIQYPYIAYALTLDRCILNDQGNNVTREHAPGAPYSHKYGCRFICGYNNTRSGGIRFGICISICTTALVFFAAFKTLAAGKTPRFAGLLFRFIEMGKNRFFFSFICSKKRRKRGTQSYLLCQISGYIRTQPERNVLF